jgi:16S rRNA (cytosine1402-N4)-methyltransferase
MNAPHIPVMCAEAVGTLAPKPGGAYVDGTFGAGGYTRAILDAAECTVYAFDRDATAIARGRDLERDAAGRLTLVHGRFSEMDRLLEERDVTSVDGIVLDLGVSSMQLDEAERGFSFMRDGPLDMRMNPGDGPSAAEVVNRMAQDDLVHLLRHFGEERRAAAIAKAIVRARAHAPITRTETLAKVVETVLGPKRPGAAHPATRTFQALRLCVNRELDELAAGLDAAERLLAPAGRLVVVAFHSLEDRIVKLFLQARSGTAPKGSRHLPEIQSGPPPSFALGRRGAIKPSAEEIEANPRARSARLRWAERTEAAAHAPGFEGLKDLLGAESASRKTRRGTKQ